MRKMWQETQSRMEGSGMTYRKEYHLIGKVYDLTQENMCAMLADIDEKAKRLAVAEERVAELEIKNTHYLTIKELKQDTQRERTENERIVLETLIAANLYWGNESKGENVITIIGSMMDIIEKKKI